MLTRPVQSTISASQIEESQLQFGYGDAPGVPPADVDNRWVGLDICVDIAWLTRACSGLRSDRTRMRMSARNPSVQRLFLGRRVADKADE